MISLSWLLKLMRPDSPEQIDKRQMAMQLDVMQAFLGQLQFGYKELFSEEVKQPRFLVMIGACVAATLTTNTVTLGSPYIDGDCVTIEFDYDFQRYQLVINNSDNSIGLRGPV